MTQQYSQRNINQQGDSVSFANTVGAPDVVLQPSVQLAQIDSTAAASVATLPPASSAGQNAEVTVVKTVTANTVTIAAAAGDTLVAGATVVNPLVAQWASLTVKADPANDRWIAVAGTA